jgi:WD40 repeat protein
MLEIPEVKTHRDVVKFLEKIRPAFLNGEVLYEDITEIVQSVLTAYSQTKEVTDEKIAKVINDFLKLVTAPGRKPPKTPDIFTGSLIEPLKSRFETNLNYPIDLLILHAIAQSRGQEFYLPKPELSSTARTKRLTRELTKARKKYDTTMLKTEGAHIDEEEIRFLELRLTHQEQQGEQQDQEVQLAERTSALEHEERKFQQELAAQDALDRLSQRSAELSLREANLSLNKELLTKAPAAIKPQRSTAEQIRQSLASITTQLGSITEVMEEAIEKQTTILLTKSAEISTQIQELAEQNEETSEEFIELFGKLEQQATTYNQETGKKIQGISQQLDTITKAQEQAMLPLQQELQSIQRKIQESDETTLEQSTRFHTDLQRIQEAIKQQAAHHQKMTKQHLTEFQNLSKKIDELEGVPDQLDEMLDTLSTGLEDLSRQNQEAFQALGQTMETLLTQNEANTKRAIDQAVATITTSQNQNQAEILTKLEQLTLILSGRAPIGLIAPEQATTDSLIARLKDQMLTDEDMKAELELYIPVTGSRDIDDKEDKYFDLETEVNKFLSSEKRALLLLGDSGAGKSTFGHFLISKLWREYKPGNPIPLFIPLTGVKDPRQRALAGYFKRKGFSPDQIEELRTKYQFIIIFDGYDEIGSKANLYNSNQLSKWNIKLITSCRTQYLMTRGESYRNRFLPSHQGEEAPALYQELVVRLFSDKQIDAYLQKYVQIKKPLWGDWQTYKGHIDQITGLKDLIETPFILRIVSQVLPEIVAKHEEIGGSEQLRLTRLDIYDAFTHSWFERQESKLRDRGDLDDWEEDIKEDFLIFSQELAMRIYESGQTSIRYKPQTSRMKRREAREEGEEGNKELAQYFGSDKETSLIRTGCPIQKKGEHEYAFLHKSLMEYFVLRCLAEELTQEKELSGYHLNQRLLNEEPSIIRFLAELVARDAGFKNKLFDFIERSKTDERVQVAAANAMTILVVARVPFSGMDLSRIKVPYAILDEGIFDGADLHHADLRHTRMIKIFLGNAKLTNALMEGIYFGEYPSFKTGGCVNSISYSPDGKFMAVGAGNNIEIWDTEKAERIKTLEGHTDTVHSIAFSLDGKKLASGSKDKTVRIWDSARDYSYVKTLEGHAESVHSLAFSPDGTRLVSGSEDETVRIWDCIKDYNYIKSLEEHAWSVTSLAFSPDGTRLASGSEDKTVCIWDSARDYSCIKTLEGHTSDVNSVAFSPDGKRLASGSEDKTVCIWDSARDYSYIKTLEGHAESVHSLAFSPDGTKLASGSYDKIVRIWDCIKDYNYIKSLEGHTSWVCSVAFSPDGTRLASGSEDKTVRIWDAKEYRHIKNWDGHIGWILGIAFSPDGTKLASGSGDSTVRIWDCARDYRCIKTLEGHYTGVTSIAFSPDGTKLASGSFRMVRIWDCARDYEDIKILDEYTDNVASVAFSPDGTKLASGSYDKTVRIWDCARDYVCIKILEGHTNWVYSIVFSRDGTRLASGSKDKTVRIWDCSGEYSCIKTLGGHASWVLSLAFSWDGTRLASVSKDKAVRIWDCARDYGCIKTLEGHTSWVCSVAFSPDGTRLASGSGGQDGTVRIWDCERDYSCINILDRCVGGGVYDIVFSQDGNWLVTGNGDHAVRAWKISQTDAELKMQLHWTSRPLLFCKNANIEEALGLSPDNKVLLEQRKYEAEEIDPDAEEDTESDDAVESKDTDESDEEVYIGGSEVTDEDEQETATSDDCASDDHTEEYGEDFEEDADTDDESQERIISVSFDTPSLTSNPYALFAAERPGRSEPVLTSTSRVICDIPSRPRVFSDT